MPKKGLLDIFVDFWGHFSGGVQNGIFRTLKCAFGVLGFRGSVAGRGVCNSRTTHSMLQFYCIRCSNRSCFCGSNPLLAIGGVHPNSCKCSVSSFHHCNNLVDISDIFFFFFSGAGEREEASEEVAGGAGFNKNMEGGGVPRRRRGRGRAPWEFLRGGGGGGLIFFFSGPKRQPRTRNCIHLNF